MKKLVLVAAMLAFGACAQDNAGGGNAMKADTTHKMADTSHKMAADSAHKADSTHKADSVAKAAKAPAKKAPAKAPAKTTKKKSP